MVALSDEVSTGFRCTKWELGFSWSYASAFGELLARAEESFGPRDPSYTPLGIEISDAEAPQIWFPGNRKFLAIQLSREAASDWRRGLFQLAHETVHVLAPTGGARAPNIEEGLATLFSDEFSAWAGWGVITGDPRYLAAKKDVSTLMAIDRDAVRRIRLVEPSFARWTPEHILANYPAVPVDVATRLCQPFAS